MSIEAVKVIELSKVLALFIADLGFIPSTTFSPLSPTRWEHRARSKCCGYLATISPSTQTPLLPHGLPKTQAKAYKPKAAPLIPLISQTLENFIHSDTKIL